MRHYDHVPRNSRTWSIKARNFGVTERRICHCHIQVDAGLRLDKGSERVGGDKASNIVEILEVLGRAGL